MTNSTATLEYMRKVRTVFCPDFLAQYKSIPLWRSTVFGWTALDPVLTQNPKKAGRAGRKQRKIRRANGGKKHKSEPKRLRFVRETTYGPEGRGFESLTAYQKSLEMSRNVQSGNTQNLKSTVIQRCFPMWSVAERRKTAAASDQAAVCACTHSRYFAGGSPIGLRV